jgi:hypothetical protein
MPHRKIIRDAFEPEQIEIAVRAYERALDFARTSGDGDGDPRLKENIAHQIIEAGKESPTLSFLELTNRTIARYRVHRATMMVAEARAARLRSG